MAAPVPHLKIAQPTGKSPVFTKPRKKNLGQVLLSKSWVTESDLLKALSIHRYQDASIGEILIGLGLITPNQLFTAHSEQHELEIVDFKTTPPQNSWIKYTSPQSTLKLGRIVWRDTDHSLTFAITDPKVMDKTRSDFQKYGKTIKFVLVKQSSLHRFIQNTQDTELQKAALTTCPQHVSCRQWTQNTISHLWGIFALIALGFMVYSAPIIFLYVTLTFVFTALIIHMSFRLICLLTMRKNVPDPIIASSNHKHEKRPKVSILVPLYKETAILKRLVTRLQVLTYPTELLEICFIYEELDCETRMVLQSMELPPYMRTLQVPTGQLQTKPRALNYALDFCSGDIIGIYDAEDAPEIDQIERVIQKFATADKNIACVQCILDFYNSATNWMSRCFTVEYAILFRIILPALDRLGLPIPLGGTSVFFRRDILEKLGRWDAHNVTEDADLGYRLYQMGYRCAWIHSVTYEEANYRMLPWVKQRSRWLKGLFMTATVHFRRPTALHKNIGTTAFLTMICLLIVPWIICPLVPIILPMWLISFGIDLPYYSELPLWYINTLVITFISSELMSLYLGYWATKLDQHKHLRSWLITTILYWPITFIASYKALFEVFIRPAYWDKSEHGVNDQQYENDINKLTNRP